MNVDLLLEELGRRLTGALAFDASPGTSPLAASHPLALEIEALRAGEAASLPYPLGAKVAWFTLAPSHDGLRRAIGDLRAWLMPSLAWEHPGSPVVLPNAARPPLGILISAASPSGYYRWYTTRDGLTPALARLSQMRRLDGRRPRHVAVSRPSLFELRHRFQVALGIGDRPAAVEALAVIDADRLDSAVNTGFMRLRLHAAFADETALVADPGLPLLLQMRLPSRIRSEVLGAHHRFFLEKLEAAGDVDAAVARYEAGLHDLLVTQIAAVTSAETDLDTPKARLKGYRHLVCGEVEALAALAIAYPADQVLQSLQARVPSRRSTAEVAISLTTPPEAVDASTEAFSTAEALSTGHADPYLVTALQSTGAPAEKAAVLGWPDLPDAFQQGRWSQVDAFVSGLLGAVYAKAPPPATSAVIGNTLLDLAMLPRVQSDPEADERFDQVLLAAVDLTDPGRSLPAHRAVYGALLPIWSERRRQSSFAPDGLLLLALAQAVLLHNGPTAAGEAVTAIRSWWEASPVRVRLPWLLDALETLDEMAAPGTTAHDAAASLWADGAELIRRNSGGLSTGERALWRRIGARLGFELSTLNEYLGVPATLNEAAAVDPLQDLPANRVAIVSLNERAAKVARDELRERTSAEVLIVCEEVAGAATDAARTADVILFAWAVNKHAVFHAFNGVRERIEYVSGRGASSMVTALERWAERSRGGQGI
ncbi:hypothetical protein [Methylobacterium sp. CM6244]